MKYDHINFRPPSGVKAEANRGLAWRREFGRGGTAIGIARARDLGNGTQISPETARRMKAFFDRHQSDRNAEGWSPGEKGFPSNGRIAHALWGGDAGYAWSRKLVRQMEAADNARSIREFLEARGFCGTGSVVGGVGGCGGSGGGGKGKEAKSEETPMIESRSLCIDDFSEDDAFPLLQIESRCSSEGGSEEKWLVGYAARFGVNSLKMDDFYERIDPNAFSIVTERRGRKSPLETRALFNHDPNVVLGRFPNTLKMKVDEHGLRYEILMPESRSDIVELIQRGDIRGSSFSFIVSPGGEDWSVEEGRSIRTVKSIASLVDVGPVTYPAYPDASVSVAKRSYEAFMRSQNKPRRDFVSFAGKIAELQTFLKARTR